MPPPSLSHLEPSSLSRLELVAVVHPALDHDEAERTVDDPYVLDDRDQAVLPVELPHLRNYVQACHVVDQELLYKGADELDEGEHGHCFEEAPDVFRRLDAEVGGGDACKGDTVWTRVDDQEDNHVCDGHHD
eukprot:CAMPEP_0204078690 /NCGR_PEP_ID=MMETSP0360-20130528/171302_1 /ASSEMBLY_ACC=CAM_ASM_000342 /TAXON_ID=268821 /ORGANISM="Scrippsiella Hangoei, Strain SHTV-5" /LENGTH=131 /DNA_ID=CAMNT_0051027365 /DNA_START=39 /DNA_END=431 /DNA_ORIENTATION=+